jgi:hypothetical protein
LAFLPSVFDDRIPVAVCLFLCVHFLIVAEHVAHDVVELAQVSLDVCFAADGFSSHRRRG